MDPKGTKCVFKLLFPLNSGNIGPCNVHSYCTVFMIPECTRVLVLGLSYRYLPTGCFCCLGFLLLFTLFIEFDNFCYKLLYDKIFYVDDNMRIQIDLFKVASCFIYFILSCKINIWRLIFFYFHTVGRYVFTYLLIAYQIKCVY